MSWIYLIRHGVTAANERHLYCGSTDLPLSPAGQTALEGARIPLPGPCRFATSGMRRTAQTLALLFGDVPFRVDPRLREMDFGAFEGKSYDQLRDRPDYQAWISGDNEQNPTPGGESGAEMTARVLAALEDYRNSGENWVLVTHGGPIAAIMAALFPEEGKNRYQWQPAPGGGYRLEDNTYQAVSPEKGTDNERINH